MSVHGTDRDDGGIVRGSVNSAVPVGSNRVVATIVAGRNYDDDAGLPCFLHGLAKGIESVAFVNRPAERQVDDTNVVLGLERNGLIYIRGCQEHFSPSAGGAGLVRGLQPLSP